MNLWNRAMFISKAFLRSKLLLVAFLIVMNLGLLFVLHVYRNPGYPGSSLVASHLGSHKHGPFYNQTSDNPSRYTYMGLLTLPTSDDDVYFNATRLLVYRLNHHPKTKSQYPVHILVMKGVDQWKIDRLCKDGAKIIMVDRVRTEDLVDEGLSIAPGSNRYEYMFTKLSVFEQTQFDKICILDSDLLIRKNIDDIFKTPYTFTSPEAPDLEQLPLFLKPGDEEESQFGDDFKSYGAAKEEFYPYLVAASDDRNPGHPTPPEPSETFNAGLMLVHPSKLHLHRIKMIARYPFMYDNARMMEQSLLNLAYNAHGWFPWTRIDFSYNGVWITEEDLPYIRAAHGKFWEHDNQEFPPILAAEWSQAFGEMNAFYNYEGGN